MTDLHSHILPGMDDGAADTKEAIALLRAQQRDGVGVVALTPHYNSYRDHFDKFLRKREKAFERLREAAKDIPVKLLLGAEVAFFEDLPNHDIEPLCITGTKAVLIEMPIAFYPSSVPEVFCSLSQKGFVPIVAHVERYPYIMHDEGLLDDLSLCGALMQINADSLFGSVMMRKQLLDFIESKRVHILATDAHSMKRRPPMLAKAMKLVRKRLGDDAAETLIAAPGLLV